MRSGMVGYDAIERARMVINDLVALSQSIIILPKLIVTNTLVDAVGMLIVIVITIGMNRDIVPIMCLTICQQRSGCEWSVRQS